MTNEENARTLHIHQTVIPAEAGTQDSRLYQKIVNYERIKTTKHW